jgi:NAD kinase
MGFMCSEKVELFEPTLERVLHTMQNNAPLNIDVKRRLYGILYQAIPEKKSYRNYFFHALNEFYLSKGHLHVPKLDLFINDKFVTKIKGGTSKHTTL